MCRMIPLKLRPGVARGIKMSYSLPSGRNTSFLDAAFDTSKCMPNNCRSLDVSTPHPVSDSMTFLLLQSVKSLVQFTDLSISIQTTWNPYVNLFFQLCIQECGFDVILLHRHVLLSCYCHQTTNATN